MCNTDDDAGFQDPDHKALPARKRTRRAFCLGMICKDGGIADDGMQHLEASVLLNHRELQDEKRKRQQTENAEEKWSAEGERTHHAGDLARGELVEARVVGVVHLCGEIESQLQNEEKQS